MDKLSRRNFFRISTLGALSITILPYTSKVKYFDIFGDDDEKFCRQKFQLLVSQNISKLPIGEVIGEVGKSFSGTSYVAGTLDKNAPSENLVINLTGLDCVTFVENCLVFARCLKMNKTSFDDYLSELQKVRYRHGIIDGYPSRLHYFNDWIYDNEEKGTVKNITAEIGGIRYDKEIDFMSKHVSSYKQLADTANLEKIREIEGNINSRIMYYIPKNEVKNAYPLLQTGDIIATTTSIPGLDVTHTGYVYKTSDTDVYFMHASSKAMKVVISDNYLSEYLYEDKKKTGIMVARPADIS